ncbi:mycofactocin biosynthesis glycosyltransferase MftF [Protofrankia symbiont of Coriaria ruscifolia]|uniref:mycofactocin biosynthesis glycosyltransferase MftF n=1 Tax=Protofrankia symbiont of Coriaria ruscifolia TaxID=1306542 RepID=UPI001A93E499|nr:mycofactocin biosynthesis glycosyltransferase MftF [Protofrankia symbiont of Coriaria ruscifolia]
MTDSVLRLVLDPGTRRWAGGRVLLGGSPLRVLRLPEAGARLVEKWMRGQPVGADPAQRRLAARLVTGGIAHPVYERPRLRPSDVTVVVPVRDHADALDTLLGAVGEVAEVIVVDDGSVTPLPQAAVRHRLPRGPAAARNTGWQRAGTELVAFLDADVKPEPGWLEPLLAHFDAPDVAAVAPRVTSLPGRSLLARYEQTQSCLDLGGAAAPVRPASRVSYVPSAALVVRTSALRELHGFDERMRFGEDVDFVWRLVRGGAQVRYEPASRVGHAPRGRWTAWLRQRFDYGTSAAPLAARHGTAVTPVRVSVWSALSWAAVAAGRPRTGLAVAATTTVLLPRKLGRLGVPAGEALRVAVLGHLGAGRLLADAVTRTWWPVAVPVLASTRRGRWLLALVVGRHLHGWYRRRPPVDLPHWLVVRILDDLAYGAGVWWGAVRGHTLTPLLPDLSGWPGRSRSRVRRQQP